MSDFQKLTLKRCARNFLILCGFILLVYGMVKFTFVLYATVAVIVLTIAGGGRVVYDKFHSLGLAIAWQVNRERV